MIFHPSYNELATHVVERGFLRFHLARHTSAGYRPAGFSSRKFVIVCEPLERRLLSQSRDFGGEVACEIHAQACALFRNQLHDCLGQRLQVWGCSTLKLFVDVTETTGTNAIEKVETPLRLLKFIRFSHMDPYAQNPTPKPSALNPLSPHDTLIKAS